MELVQAALQQVTHGVYIIGTREGVRGNLMTAAWLCQTAKNPPMLAVAVGNTHYTAELIRRTNQFSVSILTERQRDIARICGSVSGRETDKTTLVPVCDTQYGLPGVADSAACLVCEVKQEIRAGDHVVYLAQVLWTSDEKRREKLLVYDTKIFSK